MAAMTTATNVPSVALLAAPVKAAGRVTSAPLSPVFVPVILELAPEAGAVLKLEVELPVPYGAVAIVGAAPAWPGLCALGTGDRFVTGAADDFGAAG